MKSCYIVPVGKAPTLKQHLLVRITNENLTEVCNQYYRYGNPICVSVAPNVRPSGLLKFIEDSPSSDLVVSLNKTPDVVFLSRFSVVKVFISPQQKQFPKITRLDEAVKECKTLCRKR